MIPYYKIALLLTQFLFNSWTFYTLFLLRNCLTCSCTNGSYVLSIHLNLTHYLSFYHSHVLASFSFTTHMHVSLNNVIWVFYFEFVEFDHTTCILFCIVVYGYICSFHFCLIFHFKISFYFSIVQLMNYLWCFNLGTTRDKAAMKTVKHELWWM